MTELSAALQASDPAFCASLRQTEQALDLLDVAQKLLVDRTAQRDRYYDALVECLEWFEDREDVEDGDYGQPRANEHMRMASLIRAAFGHRPAP
jgi:hypothetical protein